MSRRVAVDLGDTAVVTVVDPGGGAEAVELEPDLAAVFAPDDAALVTGAAARARAAADPTRLEPRPRRYVDADTLLLGTRTVGVVEALGAVLAAAVDRAGPALRGERPDVLVLTHPAGWGARRREVLRRAGAGLAAELELVAEPLAAAAHARWMRPTGRDGATAVLDVGARGASVAVVDGTGRTLAHRASDAFGGDDADELVLAHVVAGLTGATPDVARVRAVVEGAALPERRHRQVLVEDVRDARERLSESEQAEIPLPGAAGTAWCSRGELEDLLREPCAGLVALLAGVLDEAGVPAARLADVRLIGGLARTPLLATLVHRELGVPPVVPADPRTVVARGALLAAAPAVRAPAPAPPARPVLLPNWPPPPGAPARPTAPVPAGAPTPGPPAPAPAPSSGAGPRIDPDGPTVRIAHELVPAGRPPARVEPTSPNSSWQRSPPSSSRRPTGWVSDRNNQPSWPTCSSAC